MSSSPLNLEAAHLACLNEALRRAPLIIEHWRTALGDLLNHRYTSSLQNIDKRHLRAAMLALQKHHAAIGTGFVAALMNEIASDSHAGSVGKPEGPRSSYASVSFDELELMGDNQVQDTVDSARVLQTVTLESEGGLAAFSARLSTAQGFAKVEAEKNPLRPEIFSRALLKAVQAVPVDNAIRSLWFTHGGALMGQQIESLYLSLNDLLIQRGVAPASYRVITDGLPDAVAAATVGSPIGATKTDPVGSSGLSPPADVTQTSLTVPFAPQETAPSEVRAPTPSQTQLRVNRLRRLLVGSDELSPKKHAPSSDSEATPYQEFVHTLPSALSVLDELEQQGAATPRSQDNTLSTKRAPFAELREQLKYSAKSLGQSLAIDVVSLMIERIANDPRLLLPVQQTVADSEPAFLRLAVTDPRFFVEKSHPARRLLEAITSESLAFANESSPGFSDFLQDLRVVTAMLTREKPSPAANFDSLLADFKKKVSQRHAVAHENYSRMPQALREAEQSSGMAKKISVEISMRPDFVVDNATITKFLTGPWSLVLAKERIAVDADKTGLYKAIFSLTLGELLWSMDAEKTAPYPKRLAKLIPGVLNSLHGGLLSIGFPLNEARTFFQELLKLYQSSLSASGEPVMVYAVQAAAVQNGQPEKYSDGVFGTGHRAFGISAWLALRGTESPASEKEVAYSAEPQFQGTQPFLDTASGEAPEPDQQGADSEPVGLGLGAWVELIEDDQWVRAQLTWISLHNTMYLFTSAGGRTHFLIEPLLRHFLLQGLFKVISHEGMLAGALDQMARQRRSLMRDA